MANTPPKGVVVGDSIVPAAEGAVAGESQQARKKRLLQEWAENAKAASLSHRFESRRLSRQGTALGVAVIVLSGFSLVLSALTATANILGAISAVSSGLAIVLASIQTFVRLDARSAGSHAVAGEYAAVLRRIGELLAVDDPSEAEIAAVRERLDDLATKTPIISEKAVEIGRKQAGLSVSDGSSLRGGRPGAAAPL